jgi:hypothetical protein
MTCNDDRLTRLHPIEQLGEVSLGLIGADVIHMNFAKKYDWSYD